MRITFLVPSRGSSRSGGIKVIYEYANGLSRLGHDVRVLHFLPRLSKARVLKWAFYVVAKACGIQRAFGPHAWMDVFAGVKVHLLAAVDLSAIPEGDVIVAGTWWLAEGIKDFPSHFGRQYQFVQEYEFFMSTDVQLRERMAKTYQGAVRNVVISPACRRMVETAGGRVYFEIPNGLSHDVFHVTVPINSPLRMSIGFPARTESFKRTQDAIEAITLVRQSLGDAVDYWCFGATAPLNLPAWCRFDQKPSDAELVALYNRCAVFIVPSEYEGWGLPGSEAMCCGAVLVSTRNGGVDAYARDGETAVLVEPGRPEQLAAAVLDLLADDLRRRAIAERGNTFIRRFTWERSVASMNRALSQDDTP